MNKILQKRIEEAAKKYCQDKNYILPDDTELSLEALTAIDAYIEGAKSILQNQWISVDEALPEKEGRYLCNYHHKFSNSDDECDCIDLGLFKDGKWYIGNNEVTHWMEIPSLKGGGK